jgi:hypothetical protein
MGLEDEVKGMMSGIRKIRDKRKSDDGKYTVIGVDKFDYSDWVEGKYDTPEEAVKIAREKTKEAIPYASSSSIATKYYAYDPSGKYLGGDTWEEKPELADKLKMNFGKQERVAPIKVGRKYSVIKQKWMEFERGWGARPDGYTLHITSEDKDTFVKDYQSGMPNSAPDEYSQPMGSATIVNVDEQIYQKIKESKHGIWKI